MGKIVVSQFVTLDGVFQDPGGSGELDRGGWAFRFDRGPEGDRFKLDELATAGAFLLGRVTYQAFAEAWPSRTDDVGFADKMNGLPKYVVSSTLDRADWNNSTVINGDIPEEARKLKQHIDGDILIYGSGQLVHTLVQHDLIDEYRLMVYPVILGSGKRLFTDTSTSTSLQLVNATKAGACMILTYRPLRAEESAANH